MKFLRFLSLSLILSLVACSKDPDNIKRLRVNLPTDPATLDPRRGADIPTSTVHFMLYEGLTRDTPDPNFNWGVARAIKVSDDKLTYTFKLRHALWSDGMPVTAKDFEYAWKTMLAPDFPCPNAHLLYPIKNARAAKMGEVNIKEVGVHAAGPRKLIVTLEAPTPYFLDLTSFCVYSPIPHLIAEKDPKWFTKSPETLPTNGPFTLESWRPGNDLKFTRNPLYWKKDQIEIETVDVSLINDESTVFELFEKGQIDILGSPFSSFPIDAAETLNKNGLLDVKPAGGLSFCAFNTTHAILSNKHIRKALSLAIDRESITKNATLLGEIAAFGMVPPTLRHPIQESHLFESSHAKAKEHLELGLKELKLSLKDLQNLEMIFSLVGAHKRVAQTIQEQWLCVLGIKVSLRGMEHKTFIDVLSTRNYDISLAYLLTQYADQMNIFDRFKYSENPKNYPAWQSANYISLLDQSMLSNTKEERFSLLAKAEEILIDDMPVAPLFYWSIGILVNPKLDNIGRSKIGGMLWEGIRWRE